MNRAWIVALVLIVAAGSVLGAQALTPQQQDLGLQLAELNATLQEIKEVLAEQLETDSLDLLLKRSELVSAEVVRLEAQLRNAQKEHESAQFDVEQMQKQMESFELQARADSDATEEYEIYSEQMEMQIERTLSRMRTLDGEIQELQNRLTTKREEMRSWQDMVDRRLGGV